MVAGWRRCNLCWVDKQLSQFYFVKHLGIHEPTCLDCASLRRRKRRWAKVGLAPPPPSERCDICGSRGDYSSHGRLVMDHDHGRNQFRGWLCWGCNVALGHAGDNPRILDAMATYLKRTGYTVTRSKIS